jgi:electron transfer flavoprotein alpha/beta subunit
MSLKIYDGQGRWRNKTVAFRISPEEDAQLETAVALSGLTKQDYIIRRLQCRDVIVVGNPRVYKALRNQLAAVLEELQQIAVGGSINADLLDTIRLIAVTMDGLQSEL